MSTSNILGRNRPVIIKGTDVWDYENDTTLKELLINDEDYDFQVRDQKEHKSILSGKRSISYKGDYANFEFMMIKPSHITTDVFHAHLNDIYSKLKAGASVTFYPHEDSIQYVECLVKELKPFHWKERFYCDAYQIKLISIDYFEIDTVIDYLVDQDEDNIITDDTTENKLIL